MVSTSKYGASTAPAQTSDSSSMSRFQLDCREPTPPDLHSRCVNRLSVPSRISRLLLRLHL
eukprot:scaffold3489_cov145-Pinguiococcus_pyrenoidosus.AAC.2